MTKFDWILLVVLWSLVPLAYYISRKQNEKYRRWQKEDAEMVTKWKKEQLEDIEKRKS